MRKLFTVRYTQIVKGCAVMLLLFHHLFYAQDRYRLLDLHVVNQDGVPYLALLAIDARVCVSVFLMLSGYGIYKKLRKEEGKPGVQYKSTFVSLKKVMINYWYIFLVFVPVSLYLGKAYIYQNGNFFKNFILDFLGVAKIFNSPTMNGAWWYMSVVILSYLLAPVLFQLIDRFPKISVLLLVFFLMSKDYLYHYAGMKLLLFYVLFFAEGMLLAKLKILDSIVQKTEGICDITYGIPVMITVLTVILSWIIRRHFDIRFDSLFGFSVIMFCIVVISRIKYVADFFTFVGKHSGNMFFAHSFYYSDVFLKGFIYGSKNPFIAYIILFALSLGTSVIIEKIKTVTEIKGA